MYPCDLPAWQRLQQDFEATRHLHMRDLFRQDPGRAERYWLEAGGIRLDYSKNRITDRVMNDLVALAEECRLPEKIAAMFAGEKINRSEHRAALHTALRNLPRRWWWTAKT